jgi:hypothetical protein
MAVTPSARQRHLSRCGRDQREHVLSVLETLSGRAPKTNTEDPLASAARLVRNAALELWAKPSHDGVEANLERQSSRLTTH